ncbi:MAG: hypothetical protein K0S12_1094 [Bacteroidetes bacterium]|nr:hypothetical protein [Bacteroidota bacterium]
MRIFIPLVAASMFLSSCASMFMPKKQKITFTTNNKNAVVYLDNEEIGRGESFTAKIRKEAEAKQIVVKTPGHKDTYAAIVPFRRSPGYWVLQIPNPIWLVYYGFWIDAMMPKNLSYQNKVNLTVDDALIYKTEKNKYVDITNIKLNIKDKNKDIKSFYIRYSETQMDKKIKDAEREGAIADAREEAKLAKKKKKNNLLEAENKQLTYDDTKFSTHVYKTLKSTGFVDTVNRFFPDYNNTLYLEGSINKITEFRIWGKRDNYKKNKLYLTWYIKNNFNEILDSVDMVEYSGDFVYSTTYSSYSSSADIAKAQQTYEENLTKTIGDAIDRSYLHLHANPTFQKYLQSQSDFSVKNSVLNIPAPKSIVADKTEASQASVIVKTSEGHGSGFAISEDGYILTNYHIIAGRLTGKLLSVKTIGSDGEEMVAEVVRFNKYRDIALLKVNKKFTKAFKVTKEKTFKNMQDVLTIGAPKSVELGQTISLGIISNERKANNNNLLQLNMSINSGNSGGPIFDNAGILHGVVVSKAVGKNTEGISFAIPGYLISDYLNLSFN